MRTLFSRRSILALAVLLGLSAAAWADEPTGTASTTPAASSQPAAQAAPAHKKKVKKAEKKKNSKIVWVCPMGDYSGPRTKDGKCPNCGMDLVKAEVPADGAPATATAK